MPFLRSWDCCVFGTVVSLALSHCSGVTQGLPSANAEGVGPCGSQKSNFYKERSWQCHLVGRGTNRTVLKQTYPPLLPYPHYSLLLHPVLFFFDLIECVILHLFACLFPVFLLHGCKCCKNSDNSNVIHQWGLIFKTVFGPCCALNIRWINEQINSEVIMCTRQQQQKQPRSFERKRDLFPQKKMVIHPYFWNTWLWAWCLMMNRDIYQQALAASARSWWKSSAKMEEACPCEHPGQLTKTCSCSFKLRAWRTASSHPHRRCRRFWKKKETSPLLFPKYPCLPYIEGALVTVWIKFRKRMGDAEALCKGVFQ